MRVYDIQKIKPFEDERVFVVTSEGKIYMTIYRENVYTFWGKLKKEKRPRFFNYLNKFQPRVDNVIGWMKIDIQPLYNFHERKLKELERSNEK